MKFPGILILTVVLVVGLASRTVFAADVGAPAAKVGWRSILKEDDSYRRLRELAIYADSLQPQEIPGIIAQVEATNGPGREILLQVLSNRLVEAEPEKALAAARKEEMRKGIAADVYGALYGAWAQRDPAGALAAVEQLPDGGEKADAIWALIYQIAETNPQKAHELLDSVRYSNLSGGNHLIYAAWAEKDSVQATQTLLQSKRFAYDAVEGVTDHFFEKDPQAAANWVMQLPKGRVRDEALKRLARRWSLTDPEAAATWLMSLPQDTGNSERQEAVFQWSGQDPQAALAYVLRLPDGGLKPFLTERCISSWGYADGPAALKWAEATSSPEERTQRVEQVFKAWGKADPAAAAEAEKAFKLETASKKLRQIPAVALEASLNAKKAPAFVPYSAQLTALLKEPEAYRVLKGMLAFVDGLKPGDFPKALAQFRTAPDLNRDEALDVLIGRWMEVDPDGAVKALPLTRGMEDEDFAKRAIGNVFAARSAKDPVAAFDEAMRVLYGEERRTALKVVLANMARKNPQKALALLKQLGGDYSTTTSPEDFIIPVFEAWAAEDEPAATKAMLAYTEDNPRKAAIAGMARGLVSKHPLLAVKWVERLPKGAIRDEAVDRVSVCWAVDSGLAAMKWMESLPASSSRDKSLNDITVFCANYDAIGSIKYGRSLPEGPERSGLVEDGLWQWTYDDAPAAVRWVEALPESKEKNDALRTVICQWDYDAVAPAKYVMAMPDGEVRRSLFWSIARSWSDEDPAAAAQWVKGLPECPQKDDAKGAIIEKWSAIDLPAAQALAKELPPGKAFDGTAKNLSRALLRTNPAEALKYAESIGDAKLKQDDVTYVLLTWLGADKTAASAAVKSSSLPEEVKEKLLTGKLFFGYKDYIMEWGKGAK